MNKTYFAAILLGLTVAARVAGFIPQEVYEPLMGLFGATGLAALRHAVSKGVK